MFFYLEFSDGKMRPGKDVPQLRRHLTCWSAICILVRAVRAGRSTVPKFVFRHVINWSSKRPRVERRACSCGDFVLTGSEYSARPSSRMLSDSSHAMQVNCSLLRKEHYLSLPPSCGSICIRWQLLLLRNDERKLERQLYKNTRFESLMHFRLRRTNFCIVKHLLFFFSNLRLVTTLYIQWATSSIRVTAYCNSAGCCKDYLALVIDDGEAVVGWWQGKPKYSEKNRSQYHFVCHKSHMAWPRLQPRLPRWEAGV
jgi:hypothetical protein